MKVEMIKIMEHKPRIVHFPKCKPGEFRFAAAGFDHPHIYGMIEELIVAGGELVGVWDDDPSRITEIQGRFPDVVCADTLDRILEMPQVLMVVCAAIPSQRCAIGLRCLEAGKHFLSDKAPFTSLEQLLQARKKVAETGRIWSVCYSERLHSEAGYYVEQLIQERAIGDVVHVQALGPHRSSPDRRPPWFFRKSDYGGVLIDLGCHQIEQFLYYTGSNEAQVVSAFCDNVAHPEYPEFEDLGGAELLSSNGSRCSFRVDWLTPAGLRSWGDGRTFITGTEGYIECRKYVDITRDDSGEVVYFVNRDGEFRVPVTGTIGYPFFGRMIHDVLYGTETAIRQDHVFRVAELSLLAQEYAETSGAKQDV